jgi:hypothetical protein
MILIFETDKDNEVRNYFKIQITEITGSFIECSNLYIWPQF